jgi:adenosylhomocysteine nucleosidase
MSGVDLVDCEDIGGRRVLFVMAAAQEYGVRLRARIRPLMTGVGPVEAALVTGMALQRLHDAGRAPALVVSLGSAGSRLCELGQVYQVSTVSWRDMDASRLGFARGVTPFLDHPVAMPLVTPIDGLATASLSTGANIVGGEDYAGIDADMVDMETFAVLRACQYFSVPLMGLRGISDGPGELDGLLGWTQLLALLDARLADAVSNLEDALLAGVA